MVRLAGRRSPTQSGDLNALTHLLASDVRVVTDGGGKVRAALEVIEGADHVAQFLIDATRPRPGQWWRKDFTVLFAPHSTVVRQHTTDTRVPAAGAPRPM